MSPFFATIFQQEQRKNLIGELEYQIKIQVEEQSLFIVERGLK